MLPQVRKNYCFIFHFKYFKECGWSLLGAESKGKGLCIYMIILVKYQLH